MFNARMVHRDVEEILHVETVVHHKEMDVQMPQEIHNVTIVEKWDTLLVIVTKNSAMSSSKLITSMLQTKTYHSIRVTCATIATQIKSQ